MPSSLPARKPRPHRKPERGPEPVRPERPAVVVPLSPDAHSSSGKTGRLCAGRLVARQYSVHARPPSPGKTGPVRRSCVRAKTRRLPTRAAVSCNSLENPCSSPTSPPCGGLLLPAPEAERQVNWAIVRAARWEGRRIAATEHVLDIQAGSATVTPAGPAATPRRRGPRSGGGNAHRRKPAHCRSTFLRLPGRKATLSPDAPRAARQVLHPGPSRCAAGPQRPRHARH